MQENSENEVFYSQLIGLTQTRSLKCLIDFLGKYFHIIIANFIR